MEPKLRKLLYSTLQPNNDYCAEDTNLEPWTAWEKAGILIPTTPQTWISCPCGNLADIDWYTGKDGKVWCFRCCEVCGTTTIDPINMRTWKIRLETIIEKLAEKWEMPGHVIPAASDFLWKMGTKRGLTVLYLRHFGRDEKREILAELARFPNAAVVCSCNFICENLTREYSGQCIALDKIAILDEKGDLVLDKPSFSDYFDCSPEKEEEERPSKPQVKPKRAMRTANIEKLTKEMEQHLRAARAHAQATADRGNIELLPRPTQKDLAKRTGLSEASVYRCLNDPNAKVLKILWDSALDLKSIFRYDI